jgi:hypothetical protein
MTRMTRSASIIVIPATASEASEQRSWPEGRARSASKAGTHFDFRQKQMDSGFRRNDGVKGTLGS